jgi:hypothetical protein
VIARELSLLIFMILPSLTGTGHLGLSLLGGLGFFILLLFSQGITLGLAPFFPQGFHRFLLVFIVGLGYTLFSGLLGVVNPQAKDLLAFSLPMAAFGVLGILSHQPASEDSMYSFRWAFMQGALGFALFVLLGIVRELFSFGTLSIALERPVHIFADGVRPQVFLMSAPAGLFFLIGFVFVGRNYAKIRRESKERDEE